MVHPVYHMLYIMSRPSAKSSPDSGALYASKSTMGGEPSGSACVFNIYSRWKGDLRLPVRFFWFFLWLRKNKTSKTAGRAKIRTRKRKAASPQLRLPAFGGLRSSSVQEHSNFPQKYISPSPSSSSLFKKELEKEKKKLCRNDIGMLAKSASSGSSTITALSWHVQRVWSIPETRLYNIKTQDAYMEGRKSFFFLNSKKKKDVG